MSAIEDRAGEAEDREDSVANASWGAGGKGTSPAPHVHNNGRP